MVLGGYGLAGSIITELLIKFTDYRVLVAGRNINKAKSLSKSINVSYKTDRCSALYIDAQYPLCLKNIDAIVIAAPCLKHFDIIIKSIEKYNCKCFDITLNTEGKRLKFPKTTKNLYIINLGGMFPLSIIKYVGLKNIKKANIYHSYDIDWSKANFSPETLPEFYHVLDLNSTKKSVCINNNWFTANDDLHILEEVENKILKFQPFWHMEIDLLSKIYPSMLSTGCFYRHNEYDISENDEETILKAIVENDKKKIIVYIKSKSGYYLTAASVVTSIILSITDRKAGVYTCGEYLDPYVFIDTLKTMEIQIHKYEYEHFQ